MTYYFNKRLYTDVESWKVIELDEVKGEATIIKVEKIPHDLKFIEGGFAAHCVNNYEAFQNAPIVEVKGAEPFKVYRRKNGVWYRKQPVGYSIDKRMVNKDDLVIADDEILKEDNFSYHFLKVTKTGKQKVCYTPFGNIEEVCRYYYDYNY